MHACTGNKLVCNNNYQNYSSVISCYELSLVIGPVKLYNRYVGLIYIKIQAV